MAEEQVILVVDDERNHADGIAECLERLDARVIAVYSGEDAVEILKGQAVDLVITDLRLEGKIDGLGVLDAAKARDGETEVILITAYGTIDTCKDAIKRGAYDYLVKPIDIDELRALSERALKKTAAPRQQREKTAGWGSGEFAFAGVLGMNERMGKVVEVLRRVSPTDISVLIEGDSGTGKELMARAIHENSKRRDKEFRPINCAGLTESLLESELFGHAKGAFTGATGERKGLFEIADGGTLFLDEIGDMPLSMQAKLLRVLEDGVVLPVGSSKPVVVDVRVISATNHDLAKLVEEKKFRQDLYFRIKGVSVHLPSLRERPGDIPELVDYFLKDAVRDTGADIKGISDAARDILMAYQWPGNIRQLRNSIRMMVVMCDRKIIDVQDIPPEIHQVRRLTGSASPAGNLGGVPLEQLERQAIVDTLAKTDNNREKAAKLLGIGERTLYRKIKEYDINA